MCTQQLNSVGVVVGRFQVPELHAGHRYLLDFVKSRHTEERMIVVIGVPRTYATDRNPLSYEIRREMVAATYPNAIIAPIPDVGCDKMWAKDLDHLVTSLAPNHEAVLYGSRDSCLGTYSGAMAVCEAPPNGSHSGTALRARKPRRGPAFRQGLIFAQTARAAITYPTVDMAVIDNHKNRVLLGNKRTDNGMYRFIGGFVDPTDASYEKAAHRELWEEVGMIEIADIHYVGSSQIDDRRYRNEKDGIVTVLFRAAYMYGKPEAHDDIDKVMWVPLGNIMDILIQEHRPLGHMLLNDLAARTAERK